MPGTGALAGHLAHWLAGLLLVFAAATARAELQFDVFVGYGSGGANDGLVRESGWFPVACEILNDGPDFQAVFELSSRQFGGRQTRRMAIELPANTRKRFSFPMFSSGRFSSWDARLFDERGKLRAEHTDLRTKEVAWETFLLGSLARSFGGGPAFPIPKHNREDQQPAVARLTPEQFVDNPIALEGLDALYLNSEMALQLKVEQARALVAWVQAGGHLIVAPEQAQDVAAARWLDQLLPVELGGLTSTRSGGALQTWLVQGGASEPGVTAPAAPGQPLLPTGPGSPRRRTTGDPAAPNPYTRLTTDAAFESADLPVFAIRRRDGEVALHLNGTPLAVTATRGRGLVTALTFSPEREPFRSWQNKPWFWARLLGLPGEALSDTPRNIYGGFSLDAVFGAMIDTRQVRKLPVEWLLVLLVVYLAVIGPFDRWFLKRINRQMLTWVTFPAYVVFFSLLIYYIGYKLRAGETEWNELHLVDVLPRGEQVELRGRTYASLYSSANARYRLGGEQPATALRGESLGPAGGRQESSEVEATLLPRGFAAEVAVPVWTRLLYVNDWQEPAASPLSLGVQRRGGQITVAVENRLSRPLTALHLCVGDRVFDLGNLAARANKTVTLDPAQGRRLAEFVRNFQSSFQNAARNRHQAFGSAQSGQLELTPQAVLAASLAESGDAPTAAQRNFVYPAGTELSRLLARGQAVLFAWDANQSPLTTPLARFTAPRTARNTMLRLATPVAPEG